MAESEVRLGAAGWHVHEKNSLDFNADPGVTVREYQTDIGPADYVLFADSRAVGVNVAKPNSWGAKLTTVEEQSAGYAKARLKWVSNGESLPCLYESTRQITRFTNGRDPHPRARAVFFFHRSETLNGWIRAPQSLRSGISSLRPVDPTGLSGCQVTAICDLKGALEADRPLSLVQMVPGSSNTFVAVMQVYRLLKHACACWGLCFLSIPANLESLRS